MKRAAFAQLTTWQQSTRRKPLILEGARQTGKTYLLNEFADHCYSSKVYCNFEEDSNLNDLFSGNLDPKALIERLSLYHGTKITPHETLIIFDEIQIAQRALTSLKYFQEKANDFHVVAAGSLLGVSLGQSSSFPVGKVNFAKLYPLNFLEFLDAIGEPMLSKMLEEKTDFTAIPGPIHEKLSSHFRLFLFLGGMPEVINSYIQEQDIQVAQSIQREINNSYRNDFSKYASPLESIRISDIWQSIPYQLAKENKKFTFSQIEKNARLSHYEFALEWLRKAGLIHVAYNCSTGKAPIKAYINAKKFKLYSLDSGLLTSSLNAPPHIIVTVNDIYTEFKGALVENFVAKELQPQYDEYLYYWASKSQAEIDFVVEHNGSIIPVEVKSGLTKHKKSLLSFKEKFQPPYIIRLSPQNFHQDNDFVNIPLYATCVLKHLLNTAPKTT